jgi:hypothetical protein
MGLREKGWEDVNWINLAQDRDQWPALVNTIMNLLIPQKAGNSLTKYTTISISRRTLLLIISYLV